MGWERIDHDALNVMWGFRRGLHKGEWYIRFDLGRVSYRLTGKRKEK